MATTTVPTNTPTEQPTRRAALGTLTAGVLGGSTAAVAAPLAMAGEVDPHLAWEAEMLWNDAFASTAAFDAWTDEESDAYADRFQDLQKLMFKVPPKTLVGAAAVMRSVAYYADEIGCELGPDQLKALRRAAALVDRLAGGRA